MMTATGAANVLHFTEIPAPEITQANEVKIKIKAAGVNPIDTKVRSNGTFYQNSLPVVLGCDGAGEIISIGNNVSEFKVGDEVWFCNGGLGNEQGNYAEYVVIDSRWIAIKPKSSSFIEAAALPLVLITAWGALFEKGNLQTGQTVLIHAGAGGVGHVAIQLAKMRGATVITTVSSKEKAEFVRALGADYAVNYSDTGFIEEVIKLTEGRGVDLVIDTVGGEVFKQSILVSSYFGRLITLLDPGELQLAEARMRNLLIGFELMLTPILKNLDYARDKHIEILQQCAQLFDQDKLKVHIAEVFSLQQAALAHTTIEQGHTMGKLVLQME